MPLAYMLNFNQLWGAERRPGTKFVQKGVRPSAIQLRLARSLFDLDADKLDLCTACVPWRSGFEAPRSRFRFSAEPVSFVTAYERQSLSTVSAVWQRHFGRILQVSQSGPHFLMNSLELRS